VDSPYQPRILMCRECNEEFVFTAEAQNYFVARGINDDPLMCKSCYTRIKRERRQGDRDSVQQDGLAPTPAGGAYARGGNVNPRGLKSR